jgi:TPR repeat protein
MNLFKKIDIFNIRGLFEWTQDKIFQILFYISGIDVYSIAVDYHKGITGEKNMDKAVYYYLMGIRFGNSDSMNNIALIYERTK